MKTLSIIFIVICLCTTLIVGCKKSNVRDANFCTPIANQQYNEVGGLINDFLQSQNNNLDSQQKLEQLVTWLRKFNCVTNVEIYCNSCVSTYPEQSELGVTFKINGQPIIKTLDISMTTPLKFVTFHD